MGCADGVSGDRGEWWRFRGAMIIDGGAVSTKADAIEARNNSICRDGSEEAE